VEDLCHFIGGGPVAGRSDRFGDVFNPATGMLRARVLLAAPEEVATAVEVARRALPSWVATPPLARARILFRFKGLIEARISELAAIIVDEHGKVMSDAEGSLMRGLEVVEFACGIPHS
jgi:malonate-semialdehyde dehydrogenase (acetylating)/methylmalonate-semialdehyde dehydrogenase